MTNAVLCPNAREDGFSLGEASEVQSLTFGGAIKTTLVSAAVGIATGIGLVVGAKLIPRLLPAKTDGNEVSLEGLDVKLTVPLSEARGVADSIRTRADEAEKAKARKEKADKEKADKKDKRKKDEADAEEVAA